MFATDYRANELCKPVSWLSRAAFSESYFTIAQYFWKHEWPCLRRLKKDQCQPTQVLRLSHNFWIWSRIPDPLLQYYQAISKDNRYNTLTLLHASWFWNSIILLIHEKQYENKKTEVECLLPLSFSLCFVSCMPKLSTVIENFSRIRKLGSFMESKQLQNLLKPASTWSCSAFFIFCYPHWMSIHCFLDGIKPVLLSIQIIRYWSTGLFRAKWLVALFQSKFINLFTGSFTELPANAVV